jgi:hypothetical protein
MGSADNRASRRRLERARRDRARKDHAAFTRPAGRAGIRLEALS